MNELKVKKQNIATLLTSVNSMSVIPVDDQLAVVNAWSDVAARVICHSHVKVPDFPGMRAIPSDGNPTLRSIMQQYLINIPGGEVFALAFPNILISDKTVQVVQYADSQQMQRTWGCCCKVADSDIPRLFIMTAPVLSYLLNDCPIKLTMQDSAWAAWLHNWMGKFMLKHRYFDATKFNLISDAFPKPDSSAFDYPLEPTPEPVLSPTKPTTLVVEVQTPIEAQNPVKKAGMPKKSK